MRSYAIMNILYKSNCFASLSLTKASAGSLHCIRVLATALFKELRTAG